MLAAVAVVSAPQSPALSPAVRVVTVIAVVVVALVAAVVSFAHMQQLALAAGEGWRSYLIPVSIDGLVVAASMVLLTRRRSGLAGGVLAWGALGGGVLASLAANMADARPEVTAVLVAGWPAVAFAVAFELLLQQRRADQACVPAALPPQPASTPMPDPLPLIAARRMDPVRPPWTPTAPPRQAEPTATTTSSGASTALSGLVDPEPGGAPTTTPGSLTAPQRDEPTRVPARRGPGPAGPEVAGGEDLIERVRALVAESTAAGRPIGRRAIAKQLEVSEHRVRLALELIGASTGPALNPTSSAAPSAGRLPGGQ